MPKELPPVVADPFATNDDALLAIQKKARRCRSKYDAEDSPKIVVYYGVREDGVVISATPSSYTDLGRCLADVVKAARF
ncbi:hypothetical protein [Nannocystis pusilla]|uniref:hypothetical protein n=1 Tax=Nannocystis pusilla TaxID=889268 RepID=UPI003B7D0F79